MKVPAISTRSIIYIYKIPNKTVIHFITTPEGAHAELPLLLAGQDPQSAPPSPDDIATHNYAHPPRAVIFGRGFAHEFIQELKKAYADRSQEPVAWVAGDPTKGPTGMPGPGYAEEVVKSVKDVLAGWKGEDDIVLY